MIAIQDQAIKVTKNEQSLLLMQPTLASEQNHQDAQQPSTINQSTQPLSKSVSQTELRLLFQKLALAGQVGAVIIAIFLALEIVSGLTLAMVILGISWIGCEHFVPDDCD